MTVNFTINGVKVEAREGEPVIDVARRYGMGVASLPAVRYALLFDLGDDSPDDDAMLFLREVVDPPAPPGRLPSVPLLFDSNAARAEQAAPLLARIAETLAAPPDATRSATPKVSA